MLTTHLLHLAQGVLAVDPTPTPTIAPTGGGGINTTGIRNFFITQILPVLLAVLGVIFVARANRGEVSRVLTSSMIAIVGIVFIAGGAGLYLFGDTLAKIILG